MGFRGGLDFGIAVKESVGYLLNFESYFILTLKQNFILYNFVICDNLKVKKLKENNKILTSISFDLKIC